MRMLIHELYEVLVFSVQTITLVYLCTDYKISQIKTSGRTQNSHYYRFGNGSSELSRIELRGCPDVVVARPNR